ncbi:neurturin isoform X1 [Anguilla rostrata]|uniref:neurturin isoform X1 n=1 Tax=Anguilla rostrata TaxID=7938 RepID=UPI0030D257A8
MLSCQRGTRGTKGSNLSRAQADRTSASGRNDWERWRGLEGSTMSSAGAQCHLKNWKVMLWVVASLLALADGVLLGGARRVEPSPVTARVPDKVGWHPADIPEVEELGEGREIRSAWVGLFGNPSLSEEVDEHPSRWARSPNRSTSPKTSRKNRKPKGSRDCRIERTMISVRDLGLGYDSDEVILFKYCVGTCEDSRKNYDLALKALVKKGNISAKRLSARPCCRPTRYDTVSFMNANTAWETIDLLSAANCSCVG